MREIACRLESIAELRYAVVPTVALGLRVSSNQPVSGIDLRCQASGQLPLSLVRSLRDRYYPGTAWLRMPRATLERLIEYKRATGIPSWEGALDRLLDATDEASRITERVR